MAPLILSLSKDATVRPLTACVAPFILPSK